MNLSIKNSIYDVNTNIIKNNTIFGLLKLNNIFMKFIMVVI